MLSTHLLGYFDRRIYDPVAEIARRLFIPFDYPILMRRACLPEKE